MAEHLYYGGVEGGASHSKFAFMRSDGKILATSTGDNTNQYLIGIDECLCRIKKMMEEALDKAGLPKDTPLEGLGMSLSGGDETDIQAAIKEKFVAKYPGLVQHIFVGSDTQSVLATALPNGGVVLIAGTGSNCQLVNEDGSMARSGGWGHMIGDESSACWIVLRAIKTFIDNEDGVNPSKHSVDTLRDVLYSYFKISDCSGFLDHLYKDFNKTEFSGCCKYLAEAAVKTQDPLCCDLFYEAGKYLAKHLSTVAMKMSQELKSRKGGVPIVCVGSVFKSWELLQSGFEIEMKSRSRLTGIKEVTMFHLKSEASIGAAALGATAAGKKLPIDYSTTASAFYHGECE